MSTVREQRVVTLAFELIKRIAAEPPVSNLEIDRLRKELERACNAADITYKHAIQLAVLVLEQANRPLVNKLFELARSGARRRDVLTTETNNVKTMLRINPVR